MARFTAWRSSSLCDQRLIGSSSRSGSAQASGMIWQICCSANVAGEPQQAASRKRSATPAEAAAASQRRRPCGTYSRL